MQAYSHTHTYISRCDHCLSKELDRCMYVFFSPGFSFWSFLLLLLLPVRACWCVSVLLGHRCNIGL